MSKRGNSNNPPKPPDTSSPSAPSNYDDRVAFRQAMTGVKPLAQRPAYAKATESDSPKPAVVASHNDAADVEARERLHRLVNEKIQFTVSREGDEVAGSRKGLHASFQRELEELTSRHVPNLDLHGLIAEVARAEVQRFVRDSAERGERFVLLICGKGIHSPAGKSVLRDLVIETLTHGPAAPFVMAFRSAPRRLGGSGAILARLSSH